MVLTRLLLALFHSAFSHRPEGAEELLHISSDSKCALFCYLPPPFYQWQDFLKVCDPATSLFIHTDKSVLKFLHLSGEDLSEIGFLISHSGGQSEDARKIAEGYQILKADLDVAQGVLFGEVIGFNASNTQGKLVTTKWISNRTVNEVRCITFVALDEIGQLGKRTRPADPDAYKALRKRCVDNETFVTLDEIELARVQVENVLPRFVASHGREALVAKLAAALPPASKKCRNPEECLATQFVSTATWDPPKNLAHSYDKVIFVGCNHQAFGGKAVESAEMLVAPGGEIIMRGLTTKDLKGTFGIEPFAKLSDNWDVRVSSDPEGRGGITVFSRRSLGHRTFAESSRAKTSPSY